MSGNESGTFVSQVRRALIHYYCYSYLFSLSIFERRCFVLLRELPVYIKIYILMHSAKL